MKWQDDNQNTALLKDASIVNFKDDGTAELYPSDEWVKPRNKPCHTFKFQTKEQL